MALQLTTLATRSGKKNGYRASFTVRWRTIRHFSYSRVPRRRTVAHMVPRDSIRSDTITLAAWARMEPHTPHLCHCPAGSVKQKAHTRTWCERGSARARRRVLLTEGAGCILEAIAGSRWRSRARREALVKVPTPSHALRRRACVSSVLPADLCHAFLGAGCDSGDG